MHRVLVTLMIAALFGVTIRAAAQSTPVAPSAAAICGPLERESPAVTPAVDGDPIDIDALDFDLIFMDAMLPHLETTISMAVVARSYNSRPLIGDFANDIIEARQSQIEVLRTLRAEWYPDIPPLTRQQLIAAMYRILSESPGMGGAAGLEEMDEAQYLEALATLCAGETEIDRTFIDVMITHDSSSIVLAKEAQTRATHPELREMARSIITAQQYEIDQLLAWREAWFPGTPVPEH